MASPTDQGTQDDRHIIVAAYNKHLKTGMRKDAKFEAVVELGTKAPGIFDTLMTNLVGQGFTDSMHQVGAILANTFSGVTGAADRLNAAHVTADVEPPTPGGRRRAPIGQNPAPGG